MNTISISGRLTRDVELRYTQSSLACAKFSVAVDRPKRKDGQDAGTDFINCVVWGKQGENCDKFIGKGCRVIVNGRLQTGSYQKKDGTKAYTTDVVANNVEFIDFKDGGGRTEKAPEQDDVSPQFEQLVDEVPF